MIPIRQSFRVSRPHAMAQMMWYAKKRGLVDFPISSFLFIWQNITETGCKECEELEEKNIKEFLQSFVHIVQMFINSWL